MVTVENDAQRQEIADLELGSHGLVAYDASGQVRGKIPGHQFGRDQIVEQVRAVLPR